MEHEDSLPSSQEAVICPYPEPDQISPLPPIRFNIHFNIIFQYTPRSSALSFSLKFPHQNPASASLYLHTRHMPCPSHSSLFNRPNNIWCRAKITKLLITHFPPIPRYFVPQEPICSYTNFKLLVCLCECCRRFIACL